MPSPLTLVVGDKNLSSWSMRAWLALKLTGAPFREVNVRLDRPSTRAQILRWSPSARVPCLVHGELRVWDSLAITEYLAETFPHAQLWPEDPALRAVARSACAEIHSGFAALREHCAMDLLASHPARVLRDDVAADLRRVAELVRELRGRVRGHQPFLLGEYGAVDAFFAPIAGRFRTYALPVDGALAPAIEAILAHPQVVEWIDGARAESRATPQA